MGALEAEKHSPVRLDTSSNNNSNSLYDRSSTEPDAFNGEFVEGEGRQAVQSDLVVTEDDLLEAKDLASTFSLDEVRELMLNVHKLHKRDPNFPTSVLDKIEDFLGNDEVFANPDKYEALISEIKVEAALITNNSPYAEVRSVVPNHDDPGMPVSTIRAWVIGIFFSACIAFINGFFEIRQPAITVTSNVPQLLAYPLGKLLEKILPDVGFTLFGVRHSLNPGPFNRKEHMLVTLMASIAKNSPYTNHIVWTQYLYFGQKWALSFPYQLLIALSTNFIGYGLAGLCRRFLVYPSFCVWPSSLVTIALNTAFHGEGNPGALGPFGRIWRASRIKFFAIAFALMFAYFWLPNVLFSALSIFSWMTWIAPNNVDLNIITGSQQGLGLNPFPTFDWNRFVFWVDPLMVPFFTTLNMFIGAFVSFFIILALYYGNAFNMAFLPINVNLPYDNTGMPYNVTRILDARGIIDEEAYQAYSIPHITAGSMMTYLAFFAVYSATVVYGILYHRHEMAMGFKDLYNSFLPSKKGIVEKGRVLDVHNRLMKSYREVPEWWYLIVLLLSTVFGCVAIGCWPTNTSVGTVFFGIALALIFVVPIGIIYAMTGVEVSLNVLAEFIGGSWVEGNALAMCFFKAYGYITCSHALHFSNDLKLAHYLKIPPRMTFCAQIVPTLVSTFVCVAILQYQIHLPNICTPDAPFRFTCPSVNSFFTSAVLWGTVGPKKLWGVGGLYSPTLVGFPFGAALVVVCYLLARRWPKNNSLRTIHPVLLTYGGILWAPYNLTYIWPAVPVAAFSWLYIKGRYLSLWSKYNFVLSAAFSAGIAISALIQFFSISFSDVAIVWWGNTVIAQGCEAEPGLCRHKTALPEKGYFGADPGTFS
ncbi:uncharacterized protein J7T54_005247 [Emericellopsis cladophorae]|uniref:Sexual differentiation process protein isp4 n=1 Tax=Emericellopsis cladophorae TaxID=2686198 RepID=A0A9P9XXM4_9HYPO|nr:uncharacterized protein J7T54_005247 [Emericellopsis cladophorae]KAI6779433.1 hypothetical protein J7T54_005247 [Emericellopsis cladophorae]